MYLAIRQLRQLYTDALDFENTLWSVILRGSRSTPDPPDSSVSDESLPPFLRKVCSGATEVRWYSCDLSERIGGVPRPAAVEAGNFGRAAAERTSAEHTWRTLERTTWKGSECMTAELVYKSNTSAPVCLCRCSSPTRVMWGIQGNISHPSHHVLVQLSPTLSLHTTTQASAATQ
jgi:hypothetical protein